MILFFLVITKCFVYELDFRHLPVKFTRTAQEQDSKCFSLKIKHQLVSLLHFGYLNVLPSKAAML